MDRQIIIQFYPHIVYTFFKKNLSYRTGIDDLIYDVYYNYAWVLLQTAFIFM